MGAKLKQMLDGESALTAPHSVPFMHDPHSCSHACMLTCELYSCASTHQPPTQVCRLVVLVACHPVFPAFQSFWARHCHTHANANRRVTSEPALLWLNAEVDQLDFALYKAVQRPLMMTHDKRNPFRFDLNGPPDKPYR